MASFSPLPTKGELPSERRAAVIRDRERAQLLAVREQRRLARRMQALTNQLRLSARPRSVAL